MLLKWYAEGTYIYKAINFIYRPLEEIKNVRTLMNSTTTHLIINIAKYLYLQ